jgi:hypothetical protein
MAIGQLNGRGVVAAGERKLGLGGATQLAAQQFGMSPNR